MKFIYNPNVTVSYIDFMTFSNEFKLHFKEIKILLLLLLQSYIS